MKWTYLWIALAVLSLAAKADGLPKLDTPQKAIDAFVHAIDTHDQAEMAYATNPPETDTSIWPDTITSAHIVSQKEMPSGPETWKENTGVYAKRGDLEVVVDHTYLEPDVCGKAQCPSHQAHLVSTYHLTNNDGEWAVVSPDKLFFPEGALPMETALDYTHALKDMGEESLLQIRPEGSVSYRMMVYFVRGFTAQDIIRLDYDGHKAALFTKLWDPRKAVYTTDQRELSDAQYKQFLTLLDDASAWEQAETDASPLFKQGIDVHGDGLEVVFEMDSHSEYKLLDRWDSGWLMDGESRELVPRGPHEQLQLRLFKCLNYFYDLKD